MKELFEHARASPWTLWVVNTLNLLRNNADGQHIVVTDPGTKAAYDDLHRKFVGGVVPTAATWRAVA